MYDDFFGKNAEVLERIATELRRVAPGSRSGLAFSPDHHLEAFLQRLRATPDAAGLDKVLAAHEATRSA